MMKYNIRTRRALQKISEDARKITEELVVACKRTCTRGMRTGSGSNVGARVSGRDLIIVKTGGSSFINSTPDGFVITNFGGDLIEGKRKPTGKILPRGLLYRTYPKVNVVIHTHSSYSITRVSTGKTLRRTTRYVQPKMNADSPSLDVPATMIKKEYLPMTENIYRKNPDLPGFLLVDHDLVAIREDATNTEHTMELIEETAQVAVSRVTVSKPGL